MPTVSIGLPVHNGEQYLRKSIESVLAQTYKDFELIISDNASGDRTESICEEYQRQDKRIMLYRNTKNLGAARNFNLVFELSCGEYFKWMAADDEIEPDFLARCVEFLDYSSRVVLACSRYLVIDESGRTIAKLDYDHNLRSPRACERFRRLVGAKMGAEHPVWGVIRSSVLKETHLIRPIIGCDFYLVAELALKGEFGQVPEYLKRLRVHPDAYSIGLRCQNVQHDRMQGVAESRWLDPESKSRVFLAHWRRLWEYFVLVIRAREETWEKIVMIASLFYPLGINLKTMLVKELFFAMGLGSVYMKIRLLVIKACLLLEGRKC